jgi:hypothetical protein
MKKFLPLLLLSSLVLAACQTTPVVEETDTSSEVVSSEISQTFQSENADFEYTLTWNTELLDLSDSKYEGATPNAPSFDIVGGGHITLATDWIDSPGFTTAMLVNNLYYEGYADWPKSEPTAMKAGANEVYYYNWDADSSCIIRYAAVKGVDEGLVFRLEDCDSNDMKSGEAFGGLVESLVIKDLPRK